MRSSAFFPFFGPLRFLSFSIAFRCAYWCQNWCQLVPAVKIGASWCHSALRLPCEARRPRPPALRLPRRGRPLGLRNCRRRISPGTKAASLAPPSASPFIHAPRARFAPHRAPRWYLGYAVGHQSRAPRSTGHFRPSQRLARGMVAAVAARPPRPSQSGRVRAALGFDGEGEAASRRPCAASRRQLAGLTPRPCIRWPVVRPRGHPSQ